MTDTYTQLNGIKNTLRFARDIKRGAIRTRVHMSPYMAYRMATDVLLSAVAKVGTYYYPTSYGNVDAPSYTTHIDDDIVTVEARTIFETVVYNVDFSSYKDASFDGRIKHIVGEVEAEDILHVFNVEPFDDYVYVFNTEHDGIQLATYRGRRHDGVHLYTCASDPTRTMEITETLYTKVMDMQPERIPLCDFSE